MSKELTQSKKKKNLSDNFNSHGKKSKQELMKMARINRSKEKYLRQDKIVNNQLKNQLKKVNLGDKS